MVHHGEDGYCEHQGDGQEREQCDVADEVRGCRRRWLERVLPLAYASHQPHRIFDIKLELKPRNRRYDRGSRERPRRSIVQAFERLVALGWRHDLFELFRIEELLAQGNWWRLRCGHFRLPDLKVRNFLITKKALFSKGSRGVLLIFISESKTLAISEGYCGGVPGWN